jgi:hypothetical protein
LKTKRFICDKLWHVAAMKILKYWVFLFFLIAFQGFGQNIELSRTVIGIGGGSMNFNSKSASPKVLLLHTLGQSSPIHRLSGMDHVIMQGFQQPIGSVAVTSLPIEILVSPNPCHGIFQLTIKDELSGQVVIKCFSLEGILVLEKTITEKSTVLNFSHLPVGGYIIDCYGAEKKYQSVKLILI